MPESEAKWKELYPSALRKIVINNIDDSTDEVIELLWNETEQRFIPQNRLICHHSLTETILRKLL
jgi:hypothetical protein